MPNYRCNEAVVAFPSAEFVMAAAPHNGNSIS